MVTRSRAVDPTPKAPSLSPGKQPQPALAAELSAYQTQNGLNGKGQIATMLFAARLARKSGLPFDVESGLITEGEGQSRV
jgi:hypothetical protein